MKRIVLIILCVLCVCGVGYLGYVIFSAKSIASVEIAGSLQTLYIADENGLIDYEDAQLKVTYRNGNIKMVKMSDKTVDVTSFSTSLETHGKMKIVYKSFILEVDYDVIQNGLYYLSGEAIVNANTMSSPIPNTYTANTSKILLYLHKNGECDYYYKDDSGNYYMHDASYETGYNYTIVGDTLKVTVGDMNYDIKVHYDTQGKRTIKSTKVHTSSYDPEIITKKEEKEFKHYDMKTNRAISTIDLNFSKAPNVILNGNESIVRFNVGDSIKSNGQTLLLKVTYGNDSFMKRVNVHLTDSMIVNNSLDTSQKTFAADHMYGYYETYPFVINYIVDK